MNKADIITRARALVGVRFRLHGRDPATGLDCIGLVLVAAGCGARVPDDYRLRGHAPAELLATARAAGFTPAVTAAPGSIALIDCGHGQLHLAVLAAESHIHAHAGLGRIVETPGWPEGIAALLSTPA